MLDARDADRQVVRAALMQGFLAAMQGPAFFMALTFLGIGGLAQQANVPLGAGLLTTALIWAGPAQVIFLGAIIKGLPLPAIALSISLSSVRLLPMCVSLLPWLRGRRPSFLRNLYCTHHIAVTAWVESIRRMPDMKPEARLPWFMAFAHTIFAVAFAATAAGYVLAVTLPRELAAGLLFVTPVYFTVALVRNARDAIDWSALGFGFLLAPLANSFLGAGFDLLFVGVAGGTAAWIIKRILNRRGA